MRVMFPALLTSQYACDVAVVSLLKSWTFGNSSNSLKNTILEMHSEYWVKRNMDYLSDYQKHQSAHGMMNSAPCTYEKTYVFRVLPNTEWYLAVYA